MHNGMPYGRIQDQGQGHSREVDRQSPTGVIFTSSVLSKFDIINVLNQSVVMCLLQTVSLSLLDWSEVDLLLRRCILRSLLFLYRLPKVDLIILEEGKMSVRTSVRPSTKSFFDLNEIWYEGRGR